MDWCQHDLRVASDSRGHISLVLFLRGSVWSVGGCQGLLIFQFRSLLSPYQNNIYPFKVVDFFCDGLMTSSYFVSIFVEYLTP
jgi:hypothetical protein